MRSGSLLLEALLAIVVFAIFLGGIGLSLILGEQNAIGGGDRARAIFIAEQQLEAARQIRFQNFSTLTVGLHGVMQTGTGWKLVGTSALKNGYRSSLLVTQHAADWVDLESRVSWNFGKTRSGSVVMSSSLTNWRKIVPIGNWAAMTKVGQATESGTPDFQKIATVGDYAFVTSTQTSGGKGLYIFDISNPAVPVRVDSTFDLGASAYGLFIDENRLYLATDSVTKEVQVYDISSPTTLTLGNLLNTYDLPGTGKARTVSVYGNNVFVGTVDDPPQKQLYSILMSETGPMTLQSSLHMSGSVIGLSLNDGYAYVTSDSNVSEFLVVDIFDPTNIVFAPGRGIDMTDVYDGSAVATFGTSALIGRIDGPTISELTLYSIADAAVPSPPPGPWTLDVGGDVNALASIPGSKYAFVGSNASSAQLRVLDMNIFTLGGAPIVKTYNASATIWGLSYDWQRDRLFGISDNTLYSFAPG